MRGHWGKDLPALGMWLVFAAIGTALWLALATVLSVQFHLHRHGHRRRLLLYRRKSRYARHVVQCAVGLYMFVYLGILCRENMQIEGFWYYLFLGVFEAATIHYAVAKLFGPLLFGRGWCGYACWTAMVLDFLPFRTPAAPRKPWGWIKYPVFFASLAFVGGLFLFRVPNKADILWWAFSSAMACTTRSASRWPICAGQPGVLQVCLSRRRVSQAHELLARFRITLDADRCVACGQCRKVCPMDVEVPSNSRKKQNATECILCMRCVDACPTRALKL